MLRTIVYTLAGLLWVAAILAIVLPRDLQNHAHWGKVQWIPFVSPPLKRIDVIGNVLLYMPLGFLGGKALRRGWKPITVLVAAALLSLATETTQLFSHRRFPSATDFTCNLARSMAGLYFALPSRRRVLSLSEETSS